MARGATMALAVLALFGLLSFSSLGQVSGQGQDIDLGPVDYKCPEGYYVYPHETQCELFYICAAGGTPTHLYHCSGSYLFDLTYYGCNFADLVDCGSRLPPFSCPSPNGDFPISSRACDSRYYTCINGEYTLENCPNGGLFDISTGSCAQPGAISCPTTTTPRVPTAPGPFTCPAAEGNFPSPYNCFQFYTCFEYQPFLMECPSGLYYDQSADLCNFPELVNCNL